MNIGGVRENTSIISSVILQYHSAHTLTTNNHYMIPFYPTVLTKDAITRGNPNHATYIWPTVGHIYQTLNAFAVFETPPIILSRTSICITMEIVLFNI